MHEKWEGGEDISNLALLVPLRPHTETGYSVIPHQGSLLLLYLIRDSHLLMLRFPINRLFLILKIYPEVHDFYVAKVIV